MGKGKPHIANNVRTLRFHADEMTQAQLAEKVGVDAADDRGGRARAVFAVARGGIPDRAGVRRGDRGRVSVHGRIGFRSSGCSSMRRPPPPPAAPVPLPRERGRMGTEFVAAPTARLRLVPSPNGGEG